MSDFVTVQISLSNEADTEAFGAKLAQCILAQYTGDGTAIHISGQLGAGKTTLCRGILRAMGHKGAVKSPTFTLVEPYEINGSSVFHFDLYRLSDPNELDYIGIEEYFGERNLCLIEWPEKAFGSLPRHDLEILIERLAVHDRIQKEDGEVSVGSGDQRRVTLKANSLHGEKICQRIASDYSVQMLCSKPD